MYCFYTFYDSVESKHVAPLSHYMFNFTTVVFDGTLPTKINLLYVIFAAFPLQILLEKSTRTQAYTEEVEMKKEAQQQSS